MQSSDSYLLCTRTYFILMRETKFATYLENEKRPKYIRELEIGLAPSIGAPAELQDKICNNISGIEKKIRFHVTLKSKFLSGFQFSLMQKLCIARVWQYWLWCFSSSGIHNSKHFFWILMMATWAYFSWNKLFQT